MAPSEVKDNILRAFKEFKITSFMVLDTINSGHTLVRADEQEIDGEHAINRRGALYLCEEVEVRTPYRMSN